MSEREAGLAHVATVSFLASRIAPTGAFWFALGGGMAIARAAALRGFGAGVGSSVAAMLQTVTLLGPLRVNSPLTQALSAPPMGALHRRGGGFAALLAACLAIRVLHYVVLTVAFVWIAFGGVDAYVRSFEALTGWTGIVPQGRTAALVLSTAGSLFWAVFYSVVQVLVYRRALTSWPDEPRSGPAPSQAADPAPERAGAPAPAADCSGSTRRDSTARTPAPAHPGRRRFDPRALALCAIVAFGLLLSGLHPPVIGAVGLWLAVATWLAPPDRTVARVGLVLAALLGAGTLLGGLLASLGVEAAVRAARAALLVLVATWLRGAAGPEGMRELFRRLLGRARRFGWAREAADELEQLDSGPRLAAAGKALLARLERVEKSPVPMADALTAWVAEESGAFRRPMTEPRPVLRARGRDAALVVLAVLPALAFAAG